MSRVGDQLELELGLPSVQIPWGGQSPRSLTRVQRGLFLKRERRKDDRFFADPNQLGLFPEAKRGRRRYGGAPLLLPLPGGRDG